jgi:murein DD-endopeptidase MepM/ murein hydrolase activator NlpD
LPPEAPPPIAKPRHAPPPRESWRIVASVVVLCALGGLALAARAVGREAAPTAKVTDVQVLSTLAASVRPTTRPIPMQRSWMLPLAGVDRRLPDIPSRKFGAFRAHPHPRECKQGHCGVDLAARVGEPVMAVTDGRVEHIANDDPDRLGGIYVRMVHPVAGGAIVTWYMHLSKVRRGLAVGDVVASGELIGYAGKSGIEVSEPHLHFGVGLRFPDRPTDLFVDPEPLLKRWRTQTGSAGLAVLRQE